MFQQVINNRVLKLYVIIKVILSILPGNFLNAIDF